MTRNRIVTSLWIGLFLQSLVLLQIHAQTPTAEDVTTAIPLDDVGNSTFPSTVAEIVKAISNVQKNVTETESRVPNIKVAGANGGGSNSSDGLPSNASAVVVDPELELTLFEPDLDLPMHNGGTKQDTKDSEEDVPNTTVAIDVTKTSGEAVEDIRADAVEDTPSEDSPSEDAPSEDAPSEDAPSEDAAVEDEDQEGQVTEAPTGGNVTTHLEPPAVSIFSYNGASQWFNWAVAMRDPTINPEGSLSWPTIVTRGIQGIFQYYNPLRRFMARSLETASTLNSVASDIYNYRREVIEALLSNEISPDMQSINNYVKNLESNKKVAERITLLSEQQSKNSLDGIQEGLGIPSIRNVTEALDEALDQLFEPLDTVPDEWDRFAGLFGDPFSGVLRAPFYIKVVNLGLKALYVLIILAYIPFSGIENFFLAPFPPNMDSYPGILRFWGLQAMLGPDYIEDYDEQLDALSGEVDGLGGSAEGLIDEFDDYDVRRLDGDVSQEKRNKRKTQKKPLKKKPIFYNDLPDKIKPPPSRYGMDPKLDSSYISYNSPLKGSTSSAFAVIRDPEIVTSRPVSYGLTKTQFPTTQFATIDDGPAIDYTREAPPPTAVRYMILSNNAGMVSSTQRPNMTNSTISQNDVGVPVQLAELGVENQSLSPSQTASGSKEKASALSAADYYSFISGESIARPDFHVAEPIDSPSVAAVRNPYGYSVNTLPAGRAPVVLPFITKAAPIVSYTMWEVPSSRLPNTVVATPSYSSKDVRVSSFVSQPTVSVVPTSSFSVSTVSKVKTSTSPLKIIVTSVSSSVSTKYGK